MSDLTENLALIGRRVADTQSVRGVWRFAIGGTTYAVPSGQSTQICAEAPFSFLQRLPETIEKLPTFRGIWKRHRCLIPASGYYEWHRKNPENNKEKPQPYYFTARDGSPLLTIAGIWDRWRDPEDDNKELHSCAMVITEPNKFIAECMTGCWSCCSPISSTPGRDLAS